jgi:hypothetical protein
MRGEGVGFVAEIICVSDGGGSRAFIQCADVITQGTTVDSSLTFTV